MMLTLEQRRAKFAWEKVKELPEKEFVNLAKGAPALIMGNGLMPSLAFWNSRNSSSARHLVGCLLGWLKERGIVNSTEFKAGMDQMVRFDSNKYMLATSESLDFLKWLRQLAAAHE